MWFLFSKFKAKKWLKYSYEKRFKIFVALEKRVAKKLKIEPVKLEINYEDWNCFGAFSVDGVNRKIVINSILLEQPKYRFHGMETIAHETRHVNHHHQLTIKTSDNKKIMLDIVDTPGLATKIDYHDFMKEGLSEIESKKRSKELKIYSK